MAREIINTGTAANDGTGDTLRVSFNKTNNNFSELYNGVYNVTSNLANTIATNEVFHGEVDLKSGIAFDTANEAFFVANSLQLLAQTSAGLANSAANTANYAADLANVSFDLSNTLTTKVNITFSQANAAFDQSNLVYVFANTRGSAVNTAAAFGIANASFDKTNNSFLLANSALTYAFSAYDTANGAFDKGNTAFAAANSLAAQAGVIANAGFFHANSGYIVANASFGRLNTAWSRANAIYDHANNIQLFATYVSVHANSSYDTANGAFRVTNASYTTANAGYLVANGAFRVANAGFARANAALPNVDSAVFNGRLYTANTLYGGSLTNPANGVYGTSSNWYGVYARSSGNHALKAESTGNHDAIFTLAQAGNGVYGTATTGNGVVGFSNTGYGGYFYSANGTPLGSGYLKEADDGTLQIVDAVKVTSNGMLQFDSGFGYTANAYGVRAWVNFDGTSSVSSLANLPFTANGTTKVIRVTLTGLANNTPEYNDIVVDSTVILVGTGNGVRTQHSTGATTTFAAYLAIGNRQSGVGRAYKVTATGPNWFEAFYDSPGFGYWQVWFFWWWWWYYVYGWYVPSGFKFDGTCSIMRSKIRGSGGISSVNDLGDGKYQVNFDFEMPDTNYCVTGTASSGDYFNYDWRSSSYLGVRTMHTSFVEVSSNHGWGGGGYWWWFWWIPTWTGPGTYPAKQMHIAIIR
jgi:hypothetical protein